MVIWPGNTTIKQTKKTVISLGQNYLSSVSETVCGEHLLVFVKRILYLLLTPSVTVKKLSWTEATCTGDIWGTHAA